MDDELLSTLVYRNREERDLEAALQNHLAQGRLFDAALAARTLGRPQQSAEIFEKARHYAEAAACWLEAKKPKECIAALMQVSPSHALYRSCARMAVEAAGMLGKLTPDVERLLKPWLESRLGDTIDSDSVFALGDLYAKLGQRDRAKAVYRRLLGLFHDDRVQRRIDRLDLLPPPRKSQRPSKVSLHGGGRPSAAPLYSGRPPRPEPDSVSIELDLGRPLVLAPGSFIDDRFRIEVPLGEGASAAVFLVTDLELEDTCAMKVFRGPFDSDRKARFKREIHLARKLTHENIVRIYELVAADGLYGFTMEIVDGMPFDRYVEENETSLSDRRALMTQVAAGIGYAHSRGIVHRDIKPDNVFVTHDGRVKIMDFGIAKTREQVTITMTGSMGGTPYYVAPEQITDFKTVDHRADIYALGVMAYQIFAGVLPFRGDTLLEVLRQHTEEAPSSMRRFDRKIPAALDAVVMGMLEKDPADRYQSCEELIAALRAVPLPL